MDWNSLIDVSTFHGSVTAGVVATAIFSGIAIIVKRKKKEESNKKVANIKTIGGKNNKYEVNNDYYERKNNN